MAMYFMDGKTFIDKYIEEDPDKVLRTQFVIISSRLRKSGGKYEKQIINANNLLYPHDRLIMDYDDYKHNQNYKEEYVNQINEHKAFFATLIKYVIEENSTIVFLCAKCEKKYNYLKLIQEYLDNKFQFHMYDYKKYKEGKEKPVSIDRSSILIKVDKILKKAKKKEKEKMLSTESGRKKLFSNMSKKELKKELKKRGLYISNMDKEEMIDMLDTFII